MRVDFRIKPRKVALFLSTIAVVLAIMSFIADYVVFYKFDVDVDTNVFALLLDLLSVNVEQSIPTWFSVLLLFSAAVLLALIARAKQIEHAPFSAYWYGLAGVFVYLSMDEGAVIHEIFADSVRETFNTNGFLFFGWQIVAVPLVILFVLLYLRFLWNLPARYQRLFVLSGAIYVGGAVVIEAISANVFSVDGESVLYLAIATIEESCEMLGMVLFIYTLLSYMVEMGYVYQFVPGELDAISAPAPEVVHIPVPVATGQATPRKLPFNPMILAIVFLLVTNGTLMLWALSDVGTPAEQALAQRPFYQELDAQYTDSDMLIVEMAGVFGLDNPAAQQMSAALLSNYAQVIVVSLPNADMSVAFAGDALPFDQSTLTTYLQENAPAQYIIFDTPLVAAIATAAFPVISR